MACFSEDCNFVKKNGGCFYDGVPPSNSPKTCEECRFFKPVTNYDRFIRKTPEELAEWLAKYNERSTVCPNFGAHDCQATCKQCWLDWLRREAAT